MYRGYVELWEGLNDVDVDRREFGDIYEVLIIVFDNLLCILLVIIFIWYKINYLYHLHHRLIIYFNLKYLITKLSLI